MWEFIEKQLLGMRWLNELIGRLMSLLGIDPGTRIGGSVQFFLYDVIKITLLLCMANLGLPSALIMELRPLPTTKKGIPKMM